MSQLVHFSSELGSLRQHILHSRSFPTTWYELSVIRLHREQSTLRCCLIQASQHFSVALTLCRSSFSRWQIAHFGR